MLSCVTTVCCKSAPRAAEVYQTARLFELLPQQPNDLLADGCDVHPHSRPRLVVRGHGDRLLLTLPAGACHLTFSYKRDTGHVRPPNWHVRKQERIGGPLAKRLFLVTDNGPSFIAWRFAEFVREPYSHVRIQYRTSQQLGLKNGFTRP